MKMQQDMWLLCICCTAQYRRLTSKILKCLLQDSNGASMSTHTARRRLNESGLRGCMAAKKPLLTAVHKRKRLAWCKERKAWTSKQQARFWGLTSLFLSLLLAGVSGSDAGQVKGTLQSVLHIYGEVRWREGLGVKLHGCLWRLKCEGGGR